MTFSVECPHCQRQIKLEVVGPRRRRPDVAGPIMTVVKRMTVVRQFTADEMIALVTRDWPHLLPDQIRWALGSLQRKGTLRRVRYGTYEVVT